METLTDTLVGRVQAIVGKDEPVQWGSPLLETTPTPIAIHQLAVQLAAAENALVEIAGDVQTLADQVKTLVVRVAALDG